MIAVNDSKRLFLIFVSFRNNVDRAIIDLLHMPKGSSLCKRKAKSAHKRTLEDLPPDYEEANYSSEDKRVEEVDPTPTSWPGLSRSSKTIHVRKVSTGGDSWVEQLSPGCGPGV